MILYKNITRFILALLLATLLLPMISPTANASSPMRSNTPYRVNGAQFVDGSGNPVFLIGANYEGHNDRAWLMWDNSRFDPNLINQDFEIASKGGINTLRVFIQSQLRDSLNYGDWGKLDTVVNLAQRHGLALLITFQDYSQPDLLTEADLDRRIAARYAGNPAIFGYDLRNELSFGEIAAGRYPVNMGVPLLSDELIRGYGERYPLGYVSSMRTSAYGKLSIPAYMDDRTAYYFWNALKIWEEFRNAAISWQVAHTSKTLMDFMDAPESGNWQGFYNLVSRTLDVWMQIRIGAIRNADSAALVTLGWNEPLLARMPANNQLNFISYHNFPSEGYDGVISTLSFLESLRTQFKDRPVVLEEFGYSNLRFDGSSLPQNTTASYETAIWAYLNWRGFGGGYKWMLSNFTPGINKFEAGLGLLDDNNQPKLSFYALSALASYFGSEQYQSTMSMNTLQPSGREVIYSFTASRGVFTSATNFQYGAVTIQQEQISPFAVWWNNSVQPELYITAGSPGEVTVDLQALFPNRDPKLPFRLIQPNGQRIQFTNDSGILNLKVQPGAAYALTQFDKSETARAQGGSSLLFAETGHTLGGAFRYYWERNGGLSMYGYPITEEFTEQNPQDGKTYTVQYFERARFEYHPENHGTQYEVLLGHLGRAIISGREGEAPFQSVPRPSTSNRLYFSETGHTLGSGFRSYWEKNGGLAQFGFPLSEEFSEVNPNDGKTYAVQYFERARFEYHPENRGTPYEVLLGQLGMQILKQRGWL